LVDATNLKENTFLEIISKPCNYGIRSILLLTTKSLGANEYYSIKDIANELQISFHFLTKVLQQLTHSGILDSHRGPTGGVRLKRDPAKLSLLELIYILDGPGYFNKCFLGLRGCGMHTPCPMHDYWTGVKAELKEKFENTYVANLGKEIITEGFRISRDDN